MLCWYNTPGKFALRLYSDKKFFLKSDIIVAESSKENSMHAFCRKKQMSSSWKPFCSVLLNAILYIELRGSQKGGHFLFFLTGWSLCLGDSYRFSDGAAYSNEQTFWAFFVLYSIVCRSHKIPLLNPDQSALLPIFFPRTQTPLNSFKTIHVQVQWSVKSNFTRKH